MALDENSAMIVSSPTVADEEYDHDTERNPHNLSRLSVCTSPMNTIESDGDDFPDPDEMRTFMSRLSIESFDADEELSDGKGGSGDLDLSSDSEPGCFSLPATPPRRRNPGGAARNQVRGKDYASENDAEKSRRRRNSRRRRRFMREWNKRELEDGSVGNSNCCSGESEGSGLMVITRPKGGRRSLCMDLDEVRACRDLGFELEIPHRVSAVDNNTSSGGNSPIANWRISSPGDDPRDVKARLKVWAQAVALASASRHGCF